MRVNLINNKILGTLIKKEEICCLSISNKSGFYELSQIFLIKICVKTIYHSLIITEEIWTKNVI